MYERIFGCSTRRTSQILSVKTSSINPRHSEDHLNEKILLTDLDSYLSKRRYTIGGVSSTKILDIKSISNGNSSQHSNHRMSLESTNLSFVFLTIDIMIIIHLEDIFQTVEESDFLTTKQLIKSNENLINS